MENEITNIKETINEVQKYFLTMAACAFAAAVLERIFAPKQTKIVIDGDIPAQLYAIGKKGGKSKAVYVSTKKTKMRIKPAVMFLAGAAVIGYAKTLITDTTDEEPAENNQ